MGVFFSEQQLLLRPAGSCAVGNMLCKRLAPLRVETDGTPGGATWDGVRHLPGTKGCEVAAMAATMALSAFLTFWFLLLSETLRCRRFSGEQTSFYYP